jgi:hypothetical protein
MSANYAGLPKKEKVFPPASEFKRLRGAKSARVLAAIRRQPGEFSMGDLQKECPGASLGMIRHLLKKLRGEKVECQGAATQPAGAKLAEIYKAFIWVTKPAITVFRAFPQIM